MNVSVQRTLVLVWKASCKKVRTQFSGGYVWKQLMTKKREKAARVLCMAPSDWRYKWIKENGLKHNVIDSSDAPCFTPRHVSSIIPRLSSRRGWWESTEHPCAFQSSPPSVVLNVGGGGGLKPQTLRPRLVPFQRDLDLPSTEKLSTTSSQFLCVSTKASYMKTFISSVQSMISMGWE